MAVTTGVLFLILIAVVPAYAQQEEREQNPKPQKQEQQAKPPKKQQPQAKGQQRQHQQQVMPARQQQQPQVKGQMQQRQYQQQAQPARPKQQQSKVQQGQQRQQQANRPSQQGERVQQGEERGVWQQHRARSWQTEHRTWQQRGGYNGYRIPEDHYRGYFGRDHRFRISRLSLEIFGGYPSFQYNGYWFSILDPWPENWSDDWYENDDVYIRYTNDGYYLFNRRHPRVGIAIDVYLN